MFALAGLGAAARLGAEESPWLVRVWKTSEGLAGNNVTSIGQTPDGFLWLVAGSELMHFDGAALRRYPLQAVIGGGPRRIRDLLWQRDGTLAFALFDGSVWRVRDGAATEIRAEFPHGQIRVEALGEDGAGGWFATGSDDSVWHTRGGKAVPVTEADGLPAGVHARFLTDRAGQVWFTKGDCVGVLRGGHFEVLQQFPENSYVRATPARDGGIWIGAGNRLLRLAADRPLAEIAALPLKNVVIRPNALYEDSRGAVWFGTYASGLFRFQGERFESVPISHRQVVSLAEDREGSIWVGTSGGGLNQVQPRAVTIEGAETGLAYEAVQALAEDPQGKLWGLTQAGLVVARENGAWQPVEGLESRGDVACLAAAPDGTLWLGTKSGALLAWRDGRLVARGRAEGIAAGGPRQILAARNGDLWLASSRPRLLQRLRDGRLQAFEAAGNGLIRALAEDDVGNIWVSANGSRLARIAPDGSVVDESAAIAAVRKNVRLMTPGPDHALWLAFDQGGIGLLRDGQFGRVTTKEGLLSDNAEVMLRDNRGWLWLVGSETIFKVREQDLAAVAEGRAPRAPTVRYGQEQGVRPIFGETVGAIRRRDGRLWIPLATSFAMIDPAQEPPRAEPPPVWITALKVDGELVAAHRGALPLRDVADIARETLELAPSHRRLDVDFTALSFRTPSNVHFRYRLEPFDAQWSESATQRSVSYSRLAAGRYQLHVRASNSEGVWNETGATLAFTVAPFFWDTWWFRVVALVAFTSAVFGAARYVSHRRLRLRLRAAEQEAAVERERVRIARDIHDDLGGRLTKIVLLTGLAAREETTPTKTAERVQEISETARQLIKSLDETVWAVNPRNDTLPHLISYVGQFAVGFLRTAEIACVLDLPPDPPELPVAADVRHHLFLAMKEALTNIVRHAHASHVTLRILFAGARLEVELTDNGQGFDSAVPPDAEADGLRNLRQRLEQIGGRCEITSTPGQGTRIRFVVTLAPPAT